MSMNINELNNLSIRDLEAELLKELQNVEAAKKRFSAKKAALALNFKKIDVKGIKIPTTHDFSLSEQSIKQDLVRRIMLARGEVSRINNLTANLGNISFKEFETTFGASLTDSKIVQILRNLHATDEEIDELLSQMRGDEDYDEIKDRYDDYKVNQMIEQGGVVIPHEEVEAYFFGQRN